MANTMSRSQARQLRRQMVGKTHEEIENEIEKKREEFERILKTPATYGELKRGLNYIHNLKHGGKNINALSKFSFGALLNYLGVDLAVSALETFLNIRKNKQNREKFSNKEEEYLNRVSIDNDISKVLDDTIEDNFLIYLFNQIKDKPDDETLVGFSPNNILNNFLQQHYNGVKIIKPSAGINERYFFIRDKINNKKYILSESYIKNNLNINLKNRNTNNLILKTYILYKKEILK